MAATSIIPGGAPVVHAHPIVVQAESQDGVRVPRVLVVDDDPHIRKMIVAALRRDGYGFLEGSNGKEALEQMRAETHARVERGTSCYRAGRCRLPNAYLYDKEIIPRVRLMISQQPRFAHSSVWIEGQRRWVFLKGCVGSVEQSSEMEAAVRNMDDVESVINLLMVGTTGVSRYKVVGAR